MIRIGGHTFDEKILGDGVVIDVGCRDFEFSKWFIGKNKVFAFDVDDEVFQNVPEGIIGINKAVSSLAGSGKFYRNGETTTLKSVGSRAWPEFQCDVLSIEDVFARTGDDVEILKLDCEGSEYDILMNMRPVPKQISVEFHKHLWPDLHEERFDSVVKYLCQHYTERYFFEGEHKLMDCLFIRK